MTLNRVAPLSAALLLAAGCGGGSGGAPPSSAVGGTVSGLAGAGLSLRLASPAGTTLQNLSVAAGATTFQFTPHLAAGAAWSVEVAAQPLSPKQTCQVAPPASGTVGTADVAVAVTCTTDLLDVGGTVSGLATGASLTLQNLGGDDLVVSANGAFTFPTAVASGQQYLVTVLQQPTAPAQTCTVTNGSGPVGNAAVTSVRVSCDLNDRPITGTLSGMAGTTPVVLQANGGFDTVLDADVTFTILTNLAAYAPYTVTVRTQPTAPWQTCEVTAPGAWLPDGSGVTGVEVSCVTNAYAVRGTVEGLLALVPPGARLALSNNGLDRVEVDPSGDGTFAFPAVASGQPYLVRVEASPPTQRCVVAAGEGTIAGAEVTDVTVTCGCAPSLGNCDGAPANGCETNTLTDMAHCGGCGVPCAPPQGIGDCNSGACQLIGCNAGFGNCSAAPGCETDLSTSVAHCGGCDQPCAPPPHATAACRGQVCGVGACDAGFGDCGAAPGCETDLTSDPLHCGDCATDCAPLFPHAAVTCSASTCQRGACDPGFDDCTQEPGCETELATTRLHCGACNHSCDAEIPNAVTSCQASGCILDACQPGFANCTAAPGCETDPAIDPSHCGACDRPCTLAHAQPSCAGGQCNTAFCDAGWGDCDNSAATGCEHDVTDDPANCGGCNAACLPDRVCGGGSCRIATSCKELLAQRPTSLSGPYTIDPDGDGPGQPVQVYCDMITDGGGWTFFAHVNDDYTAADLFVTDTGTYDPTMADGGATYGLGGTVYQHLGATELMVSVINPDPDQTIGVSLVFYQFPANHLSFSTGPVPCDPTDPTLKYRTILGSYLDGSFGVCDALSWYPVDAVGEPLVVLSGADALGTGIGSGVDRTIIPGDVIFLHDSWWYAR